MYLNGSMDTTLDCAYLAIPAGITFPNKKLLTSYEKAYELFDATQVKYFEVANAAENAGAKDTIALINAVKGGEPHPGETATVSATRELNYVIEQLRQFAAAANVLAEEIREVCRANAETMTAQAVEADREGLTQLVDAYDEARAFITAAQMKARTLGDNVNFVTDVINRDRRARFEPTIPDVHFPSKYEFNIEFMSATLDAIAGTTSETPTVLLGGRNATFDSNGDKHNYR